MNESTILFVTRKKVRFPSPKGDLTFEQLWDIPLRDNGGFNLDNMHKAARKALREMSEESIVETKHTPANRKAEVIVDVLTFVITTKLADEKKAEKRAADKLRNNRILEIIASKEDEKLAGKSVTELKKLLADTTPDDDE